MHRRIGQRVTGTKRLLILSVKSTDVVYQILTEAKLRDMEGFKTVCISPNRTHEVRISRQKLVCELKKTIGRPSCTLFHTKR